MKFNTLIYGLLIGFFLLGLNTSVQAQDGVELFEHPDVLRARYIEEKYLPTLEKPIRAEGDFLYIKDRGLAWFMDKPFEMKTVITPSGLSQWIDGVKQEETEKSKRAMKPLLKNIASIFSGDTREISEQFEIKTDEQKQEILHINLVPKSDQLKPFLQRIEISGTRYIETIRIVFAEDKYTLVRYSAVRAGEQVIQFGELELFE